MAQSQYSGMVPDHASTSALQHVVPLAYVNIYVRVLALDPKRLLAPWQLLELRSAPLVYPTLPGVFHDNLLYLSLIHI